MKISRRILCAAAALFVLVAAFAGAEDVAASNISDSGEIRVLLASLGEPTAIMVTVAGEYSAAEAGIPRLERGAQLLIAAEGSDIYVYAGGMLINVGGELTLTRCAAEDGAENGLYIAESEKYALYNGDLRIKCADGRLTPILTVGMEDYLCGVVAYEMSDSFPPEALKAQAVAARTYAMSRKVSRAGSEYDVTDTTSDQVYKGFIGSYENVIAAVEATRGVVGTYNGGYAECFYTASNGGQISTPYQIWGGDGDYGYIVQKDDPYDLENPYSLVNSYAVPKRFDPDDPLWTMLAERLDLGEHAETRADEIVSVTLDGEAFDGSAMRTELRFEIAYSVRDTEYVKCEGEYDEAEGIELGYTLIDGEWFSERTGDWKRADEPARVTLSVYSDIKAGLGLGMNARDYEVADVAEGDDCFVISLRRYGHGVGMSQRGAQTMAADHGFGWTDILAFYYPGMTLERIEWQTEVMPANGALPEALVREMIMIPPEEGDLGALGEGEYLARVTIAGVSTRLNVRAEPTTDSGIVAKLNDGYRLVVVEDAGNGWAKVRAARFTGYVKTDYITAE